jgi:uncharacterized delta-60 repeat protein
MMRTLKIINSTKSQFISGKTKNLFTALTILFCSTITYAQTGSLDTSFDPGAGANNIIRDIAIQSDGKIVVVGSFTSFYGTDRNRIVRLNSDGSIDSSFDPGTGADSGILTVSILKDGKIIIGGTFTSFNGTEINRIARLNSNGRLDTSFDPGAGADNWVWSNSIQSDGKIIIGGGFNTYNKRERNYIARLNSDGSLDTSFGHGTGTDSWIYTTSIQGDGKIIIGGIFTSYNGTGRNRIARLNTNGSLDTSFVTGAGTDAFVWSTSIQSDGKIIITGGFNTYNGTPRNHIARLNTDGTLDTFFDPGTGANDNVITTSIQNDGKIIIGGRFKTYNGVARNNIARLNSDGTLDTSFDPGTGPDDAVFTTSIQSNGKIILAGDFLSYNGTTRRYIARVHSESIVGIDELADENNKINIYPNPFSNTTTVITKVELNNATLAVYNSFGQPVKQFENISSNTLIFNRDNLPAGLYFIQLSQDNRIIKTDKLVIMD